MLKGLLGRKIGMTRIFRENGVCVPVTVVQAGPVRVIQVKTNAKDGYCAAQIGFEEETKSRKLNKAKKGHFGELPPLRHLREFPLEDSASLEKGQTFQGDLFEEGERVNVAGISKGRGFQGVIKRHGFSGGPASHGSQFHRTTGSIGNRTFPGRVLLGKRLPGHMGNKRITVRNLAIAKLIPERQLLLIHGAVPGPNGGLIEIRKLHKARPANSTEPDAQAP